MLLLLVDRSELGQAGSDNLVQQGDQTSSDQLVGLILGHDGRVVVRDFAGVMLTGRVGQLYQLVVAGSHTALVTGYFAPPDALDDTDQLTEFVVRVVDRAQQLAARSVLVIALGRVLQRLVVAEETKELIDE